MAKEIRTVGIVGTGQMGGGIGQVAAQAGFSVLLYDVTQEIVERALENVQKKSSPLNRSRKAFA